MSSSNALPKIDGKDKEYCIYKWDFKFYDENNPDQEIHPEKILQIKKVSLYKEKVMPVMIAELRMMKSDIARIKRFVKRCLCEISCTRVIYNPVSGSDDLAAGPDQAYVNVGSKTEFSATFEPIMDINTFKGAKYDDDDVVESEEADKNDYDTNAAVLDSPTQVIHVSFVNAVAQKMMKILYNEILSDDGGIDVGTVLNWICSQTNCSGYILDKPANPSTVTEIILPTLTLIPTINYLQTMYGVYENGIMPFIDYDNILYVLDKYAMSHDHEKDDPSLIHIYVVDVNKNEAVSMIRSENKKKEPMYVGAPTIVEEDDEILKGELIGNNFAFSSFNQSIDAVSYDDKNKVKNSTAKDVAMVMKRNIETHNATGEKTICDYDEMNNVFNMSSKFNELESQSKKMTIVLQNAKIQDFKVNRFVELHFQNTSKSLELDGVYYLNSVELDFDFLPSGDITKANTDVEEKFKTSKTNCSCILTVSRRENPQLKKIK